MKRQCKTDENSENGRKLQKRPKRLIFPLISHFQRRRCRGHGGGGAAAAAAAAAAAVAAAAAAAAAAKNISEEPGIGKRH